MATTNIFDSDVPQQGVRATESAHRKVELQSPLDLQYLIANVHRAAREKLDAHYPPPAAATAPEDDAVKQKVAELVDSYIRDTFHAAKDNMCINGMDSKEMEAELAKAQDGDEIEPFDTKLAQRIQALSSQLEAETLHLANLRRTAPAATAQRFQQSFAQHVEVSDSALQRDEQERLDEAKGTTLRVSEIERVDDIQSTWRDGVQTLHALQNDLGGTLAKMERAQRAFDALHDP